MQRFITYENVEIVERELYFNEIKKAILEVVCALLDMQITQKDRNIKLVSILDTG